ncbi:hypothetical protein Agabi119p4_6188 [Agaricus bisporus var. burnettii]|uniref:Glycolipid transfer protein domain-containing protein n=1 Tax=Agaricus bisporus var. burnettii TaxID=192524 RepID=A0A8H7EZJ4_AGABI|nr:hypothetical protein Agabi119p4_6188 [Agaricus bisporus var. burnettii]
MSSIKSFEEVAITAEGVPSVDFLAASEGMLQMFDRLGHGVFSFIQADIRSNIAGLRARLNAHHDPTLEAVLASSDDHAISCVVLLIRGFRYVCRALSILQQHPELELYVCFKRAYDQVLKQHHSAFIRTLVAVAIRAAPSRTEFYRRIGQGKEEEVVARAMGRWVAGLERIVTHMSPLLPYH